MKSAKTILLFLPVLLSVLNTYAWGKEGNKIAANIALDYLDARAKDSLSVYLGSTSLQDAIFWMDDIRTDPAYDYMRTFHYINIEKGTSYDPNSRFNIMSELNIVMSELKDRNKYSSLRVAMDLKILIHLIADLHTPLNVGYGIDRGGNNVKVYIPGETVPTNLHKVWDDYIIRQYSVATVDCKKTISDSSEAELNKLREVNFVQWLNESRANLDAVYAFNNPFIEEPYCRKSKLLIQKELALAGLRIASALNALFAH